MTQTELLLWEKLKDRQLNGLKFRCQHPIYRYILDFYCHERLFAIEIDGIVHEDRKDYDEYRDLFIKSIGITTLRINNDEVIKNINQVLVKINDSINLLQSK